MIIFCPECEEKTPTRDLEINNLKNGKRGLKGFCTKCDIKKIALLAKEGGDFVNFINSMFTGEKHLIGHNFTGPGTNLDKRLNEDLTPKDWSQPINRVDQAAYKHDIKYMNDNKEIRQIADQTMIEELNNISNPSFREKIERSIVIPILKTKKFLGLGICPSKLRDLLND